VGNPLSQAALLAFKLFYESLRVAIEAIPSPKNLDSGFQILLPAHVHTESETVQQLRSQFTFFRVHGSDQNEPRWMAMRYALSLHHVLAGSANVKDQVNQMIRQEIDFVYIQNSSIGTSHKPWLERSFPVTDRRGEVQPAYHHVFRRV
jgi:hypothetical protein